MPEGPEIHRAAARVARAIAGHVATEVRFGLPRLAREGARLSGRRVEAVSARGKALIVTFEGPGRRHVYTHNQLYGTWILPRRPRVPESSRQLRFAVFNDERCALLYSASDIALLDERGLAAHPYLERLGPDLLDPGVGPEEVRERLSERRFAGRRLHALLLDQSFLGGVGNYLRSEILFEARLDAGLRPRELDAAEQERLAAAALRITRRSLRSGGVTNPPDRARALRAAGLRRAAARFAVFDREGEPCHDCGALIERLELSGRRLYRCPKCQPSLAPQTTPGGAVRRKPARDA